MKKIILGLVVVFALAACSHDSGSYTVNQEAKVTNNYNTAFVKTFGQPAAKIAVDPSFNWLNERDNITQVCPNFPTYVKDGEINWY